MYAEAFACQKYDGVRNLSLKPSAFLPAGGESARREAGRRRKGAGMPISCNLGVTCGHVLMREGLMSRSTGRCFNEQTLIDFHSRSGCGDFYLRKGEKNGFILMVVCVVAIIMFFCVAFTAILFVILKIYIYFSFF